MTTEARVDDARIRWNRAAVEARKLIGMLDADDTYEAKLDYIAYAIRDQLYAAQGHGVVQGKTIWKIAAREIHDPNALDDLLAAVGRWSTRRAEHHARLEAERRSDGMKRWRRVKVDGVDVTDHVAAMFDAIVGSTEWGSDFLSVECIESILIIAQLVGFDVPNAEPSDLTVGVTSQVERQQIIEKWKAQVAAKAAAMRSDAQDGNQ